MIVFFGGEIFVNLYFGKKSNAKRVQRIIFRKIGPSDHILRKKVQNLPYLNNRFLEVAKTW